ncbi:threonine aldolase family protein [Croceicoccus gelatinilyticus]|uniref:threonine aldolase family protein n=1 Tax=Croceicoccus gelatinilyticus TaxID=2835536 RepID=UPI001BCDFDE1|nr:beta-eliminating lyase-related protein [Croceicoccus gelatinilyticus]MBS7670161.1 low specificity L-threonine aldolase [Croceicoccus gelatinilyticus]
MQFLSDNAAPVHPRLWDAMRDADATDAPYDGDALSRSLDSAFSDLFGMECAVVWTSTGTAANCLALATLVPPYGGVVCHDDAHIEQDEAGAPEFYTHGAKLMLAHGQHAKLTPENVAAVIDPIRDDVHRVQPTAIAITQATEQGCVYTPEELAALTGYAKAKGLKVHMDGARFGNAVAHLGCSPAEAGPAHGIDTLSFGMIKNGGMSAEALVLFDPAKAAEAKRRHKRAGQLQSKGRYLAAQLLAMIEDDLWLSNARAANHAAGAIAKAAGDRLLYPCEANEVFVTLSADEREALRAQGFGFYDWGADAARFVAAWNTNAADADKLAAAIASL